MIMKDGINPSKRKRSINWLKNSANRVSLQLLKDTKGNRFELYGLY